MYNSEDYRFGSKGMWRPTTPQKELKNTASAIGIALITYLAISIAIPFIADNFVSLVSGIMGMQYTPEMMPKATTDFINTITYAAALLIPFCFLGKGKGIALPSLLKPGKAGIGYKATCVGLCIGAASVGNIISEIMANITSLFGFIPYYEPQGLGGGIVSDIIVVLTSTVLAAMLEEFAFRGILLKILRPFGDAFALFASALLFAICHPSAAQFAPALVTGLALGYTTISTGSIRTAIIAHFAYNSLAVLIGQMLDRAPQQAGGILSIIFTAVMLGLGLLCTAIISKNEDCFKLCEDFSGITLKQKLGAVFTSIPLIMAVCLFGVIILTSFVPTYFNNL